MEQAKPKVRLWATSPIPEFLRYIEARRYAKKTIRNYRIDLFKIERELGYPIYIATGEALAAYLGSLTHLKAATIQRKIASLRVFFKWAVKHGYAPADPTADLEAPKKPKRLPVHLTSEDVAAVFGVLSADTPLAARENAMIKCLYYTGMRAGELVGLDVDSWNKTTGYLRVVGKGDKERLLPVPLALAAALEDWLRFHPIGRGPLFTSLGADPGRLHYDRVRGLVNQVNRRAGIAGRGYTAHKWRHTYATRLINNGVSIDKIQQLLGHSQISTTTIYAHTQIGQETRNALDRIL